MDARVAFTSVGVNRAAGALDWDLGRGEQGCEAEDDHQRPSLIAYGGASAVCLFDPDSCEIVGTLTGHTSDVRCVRWLPPGPWASSLPAPSPSPSSTADAAPDAAARPTSSSSLSLSSSCLVSGAGDGSVRLWLWRHGDQSSNHSGRCLAVLLPDGRALVNAGAQGAHERGARDAALRASSGAAATSSAAAAAAPSQRAPPASVGAASCVAAQALDASGGRVLLAVSSAAPHVALWECDVAALVARARAGAEEGEEEGAGEQQQQRQEPARLVQRLRVDGCLQHALAITPLPDARAEDADESSSSNNNTSSSSSSSSSSSPALLLASGGTDGAVRLFVRPPAAAAGDGASGPMFEPAATLTGHDNWVRGLAFAHTYADDEDDDNDGTEEGAPSQQQQTKQRKQPRRRSILLASASQDTRVRVWRLDTPSSDAPSSSPSPPPAEAAPAAAAADDDGDSSLDAALLRYAPRAAVRVPPAPQSSPGPAFQWTASLEALLSGHEDWVHAVQWRPPAANSRRRRRQSPPLHLAPPAQPRARLALLSASHDRTVALWRREPRSGVWLGEAALGDAGATCFGYFGARWGPGGKALVAHGHSGALHLWRDRNGGDGITTGDDPSLLRCDWRPAAAGGGHTAAVVDLAWVAVEPPPPAGAGEGGGARRRRRRPPARLLLQTASADQTARLFAEVAIDDEDNPRGGPTRWCELARTQVHGHDFSALAPIPSSAFAFGKGGAAGNDDDQQQQQQPPALMYACCSEEKVIRVFEAPQAFLDTLELTWPEGREEDEGEEDDGSGAGAPAPTTPAPMTPEQQLRARGGRRGRPLGAAAQALGLSNKAIFAEDLQQEEDDGGGEDEQQRSSGRKKGSSANNNSNDPMAAAEGPDQAPFAAPAAVSGPPLEEHLAQSTLWPEAAKLHGHANDAFCCAASPCGRLLASACRAQASSPRDADVLVWEVGSWRKVGRLAGGHTLTATQLAFAPDGVGGSGGGGGGGGGEQELLFASVSRDRSLAVWRVSSTGGAAAAGEADWSFKLVARVPAAHARVIWGVAWAAPASASSRRRGPVLATGARDGLVRLWEVAQEAETTPAEQQRGAGQVRRLGQLPAFAAAVTAVAAAPRALVAAADDRDDDDDDDDDDSAVLAVGLEDGDVLVWLASCREAGGDDQQQRHRLLWRAGPGQRHAGAVRRLAWAPAGGGGGRRHGRRPLLLASCGEDGAVRVLEMTTR